MNRRDFLKFSTAVALTAPLASSSLACASASPGTVMAFDTRHEASPQWYRDAYAAGYRLMVLSTNVWDRNAPWAAAAGLLGAALEAGLRVAAYTRNPNWYRTGIEACGPHIGSLSFFCLDVEIDPGVPVTRAMVDGVRSMGVQPVIYSSRGMWPKVMGADDSFSDVPLWNADHDRTGFVSYGGWSGPVGTQEREEVVFNGVAINTSSFSAGFLGL